MIEVPDWFTTTDVAGVLPKLTVDPCVNPAPSMVTDVPPLADPDAGKTVVIVGT